MAVLQGRTPGAATVTVEYTAQPTEEGEPGETATTEVAVNVIDVQVQGADVTQDSIVVQLSPPEVNGTLRLELLGSTTHVIREELRAGGMHNETFNIPNLAEGEYAKIKATWKVQEASASGELDYHMEVLGPYHHTQYNSPLEGQCTGPDRSVYVLTSPGTCFDDCSSGTLNSDFASQVNRNGSGHSLRYGKVKSIAATRCRNQSHNRPPDATGDNGELSGNSFVQVSFIDGACANIPLSNSTVAGCLVGRDARQRGIFNCGDRVSIHGFGTKTVADHCPACCNTAEQRQLDNYTPTNGSCSGGTVGDLTPGRPVTIRIFQ